MSTSTRGGLTLGLPTTAAGLADAPARTSVWRDVANNLDHLADERSRVLVSYTQRATGAGGRSISTASATAWTRIYSWGPFPLLVGPSGAPYPVRVRIGGRAEKAGSSKLRIGVCPVGTATDLMSATTAGVSVIESAAFTDATNAWRVGGLVTLDALWSSVAIVDAVASAFPRSVDVVMATVEAWGLGASTDLYCTQAYAAEYCGL